MKKNNGLIKLFTGKILKYVVVAVTVMGFLVNSHGLSVKRAYLQLIRMANAGVVATNLEESTDEFNTFVLSLTSDGNRLHSTVKKYFSSNCLYKEFTSRCLLSQMENIFEDVELIRDRVPELYIQRIFRSVAIDKYSRWLVYIWRIPLYIRDTHGKINCLSYLHMQQINLYIM